MAERAESRKESWIYRIFFLGALMKLAGDFVGQVADVLGLSKKK